ncbi:TerB family tellurite resistance protein [Nannocystis sp. ILAH1]|uniref:TerB family tellurite resistance protein n=1 Tax=unclassified Nannocystis TaxID=2627009 RepID=UPI002272221F|nr:MULTISPECIES: TerB family tellurite resistance protein [unclassified Nannocystis]MCY0987935.1 TerB family tellurite resistance protein [Nannocystis sp. ILAH1]MCY0995460.1 TerB family tellurite resistance protein [Nannocystis sp. ILAH1]MCY0995480.1 TerB family tellurite resistance protein [Nannocystis sp. ILAH1]MCY1065723.1 TerB family tellurite resistance protein [Nannocystis sp. RBIL2]
MKQHIEQITQLLLGAAYADKRLAGAEITRIRSLLSTLLGGAEVPDTLLRQINTFSPAAFNVQQVATGLDGLSQEEKRKLLELVASVNEADEELDLAEDIYLRTVAAALGLPQEEFSDLTLEILGGDELHGLLV